VDVRIGIMHSPREISFETDATAQDLSQAIQEAHQADGKLVSFTDSKGAQFLVNPNAIAYVEFGAETSRRVGFVS